MPTTPQSPRQPLSKARIAFAIVLLQTVFLFLFDAQDYLSRVIEIERDWNAAVMGPSAEAEFKDRADRAFYTWVVDSGLYSSVRSWTQSAASAMTFGDAARASVSEGSLWSQIEVFWLALWAMFYRLMASFSWLIVSAPLFAALMFDAINGREIRKWRFELSSPMKLDTYKKGAVLTGALLVYAPFALVPTPAWVVPILVGVTLLLVGGQIRSTQKRV
ncbi:hypothetical protein TK90_2816 (plasmid) [Thioalkalivibrio sp. K90mix]|uniref:DUF4400 domain-containing protein n=1 Tax=Thioalkalivibrio sp. (strain K90mix) TaxID=396595 RepID=UPI000195A7AC|nr:DUF4400 domain-containing protein [Thioalkalivibrio sp. K90mix]ADC73301.1 hypothetical protein TK90_2816 [Thioalkalivibrio sp. K90mix]